VFFSCRRLSRISLTLVNDPDVLHIGAAKNSDETATAAGPRARGREPGILIKDRRDRSRESRELRPAGPVSTVAGPLRSCANPRKGPRLRTRRRRHEAGSDLRDLHGKRARRSAGKAWARNCVGNKFARISRRRNVLNGKRNWSSTRDDPEIVQASRREPRRGAAAGHWPSRKKQRAQKKGYGGPTMAPSLQPVLPPPGPIEKEGIAS